MPVVTLYRSKCSISRGDWVAAIWAEYRFEPAPSEDRMSQTGFRVWRGEPEPIAIKAPPGGCKFDAETAFNLACGGRQGYRLATEADMARRRQDDGMGLFAGVHDEPEPDLVGTRLNDNPGDRSARLEDAIRRALVQLRAALEGDEPARTATARAILEGAVEGVQ